MNKLTREEVLHVARLARIELSEKEIEKYQVELKQLLDDVEKINDVKGYGVVKHILEKIKKEKC